MAGYVRKPKTYKLTFTDEQFNGLEVRAKGVSVAKLLSITRLAVEFSKAPGDVETATELFGEFGSVLIDWNLETEDEDGTRTPVPATAEALLDQDPELVQEILEAWIDAVSAVPAPLSSNSSNGGPSPAASIPMDEL